MPSSRVRCMAFLSFMFSSSYECFYGLTVYLNKTYFACVSIADRYRRSRSMLQWCVSMSARDVCAVTKRCAQEQKILTAHRKSYKRNRSVPARLASFLARVNPSLLPYGCTLSPERQSARMSKITNDGLTRSGIQDAL